MAYAIYDRNGNLYTNVEMTQATVYNSLKVASEKLKELPQGYFIKDTVTKKKVEPI